MARRFLPYGHQWIREEEIRAVSRVLRSDWLTQGPAVVAFERALAKVAGARNVVVFSSGTAALHAACFAVGLQPGDEAITSPLTFAASANCVLYQGAKPKFADIDPRTGMIDPAKLERAITRRTKAIIPIDYTGNLCDWNKILPLARKHKLYIIEDASHAIGATYRGKPVGSFADLTVFSFHPVKHITTGEGGAVATNNREFAKRLRRFRTHGITRDPKDLKRHEGPWYYEMQDLGYNYRLTDIQCTLGLVQLKHLRQFIRRRTEIVRQYNLAFRKLPNVITPAVTPGAKPAWHLYVLRLTGPLVRHRRAIFEQLQKRGLGVNVHYIPVHLHPYYRRRFGYKPGDFPEAERFYQSAITLPLYPAMKNQDVSYVIGSVRQTLKRFS